MELINYKNFKYDLNYKNEMLHSYMQQSKKANKKTLQYLDIGKQNIEVFGRQALSPIVFKGGRGVFLYDIDDNIYIDFASGVYVTNLGHSHPKISYAICEETKKLQNVHDYMTDIKISYLNQLSKRFQNFDYFQLYDNGSVAVEFAVRVAREITGKYEILSFYSDFHGKSKGTSSLGRINHTHDIAREKGYYLLPRPNMYRPLWIKDNGEIDTDKYIEFYELAIKEETTGNIAAIIAEPIQGWAGTVVPPDDFFPKLRKLCDKYNILLIADEILTGFGRTGKFMCMEHWDVEPDIYIIGKGMSNGFPMSGIVLKKEHSYVLSRIVASNTFGGNPMSCAAGLATLEIIEDEFIIENSQKMGSFILERLKQIKEKSSFIGDVRGKGCMLGIEFVKNKTTKEPFAKFVDELYKICIDKFLIPGVPGYNVLRLAPPLIIDKEIANIALNILEEAIVELENKFLKGGFE